MDSSNNSQVVEVRIDDLDNQIEFYRITIHQFGDLNHQYLTEINKLENQKRDCLNRIKEIENENSYYKKLLNTKVYKFASFLRKLIDKIKCTF